MLAKQLPWVPCSFWVLPFCPVQHFTPLESLDPYPMWGQRPRMFFQAWMQTVSDLFSAMTNIYILEAHCLLVSPSLPWALLRRWFCPWDSVVSLWLNQFLCMVVWPYLVVLFFMSGYLFSVFSYEIWTYLSLSTQKILKHARMVEMGSYTPDPLNESISLELDMLNIL